MYQGEERRKDYPDIKERLTIIETNWANYSKSFDEWKKESKEWRIRFCEKIDKIIDKLDKLPCDERKGFYQSINRQVTFMWVILGSYILALVGIIIKLYG
jgi:hypothetical protein